MVPSFGRIRTRSQKVLLPMTSAPIRDPVADHLLTPQNAAVLLIDYQPLSAASGGGVPARGNGLLVLDGVQRRANHANAFASRTA